MRIPALSPKQVQGFEGFWGVLRMDWTWFSLLLEPATPPHPRLMEVMRSSERSPRGQSQSAPTNWDGLGFAGHQPLGLPGLPLIPQSQGKHGTGNDDDCEERYLLVVFPCLLNKRTAAMLGWLEDVSRHDQKHIETPELRGNYLRLATILTDQGLFQNGAGLVVGWKRPPFRPSKMARKSMGKSMAVASDLNWCVDSPPSSTEWWWLYIVYDILILLLCLILLLFVMIIDERLAYTYTFILLSEKQRWGVPLDEKTYELGCKTR